MSSDAMIPRFACWRSPRARFSHSAWRRRAAAWVSLAALAALILASGGQTQPARAQSAPNAMQAEQQQIVRLLNARWLADGEPLRHTAYGSEFSWVIDEYVMDVARQVLLVRYHYAINAERLGGVTFFFEAEVDLGMASAVVERRLVVGLLIDPDLSMPPVAMVECVDHQPCYSERIVRRCNGLGEDCLTSGFEVAEVPASGLLGYWRSPEHAEEGKYWLQRLIDLCRDRPTVRASS